MEDRDIIWNIRPQGVFFYIDFVYHYEKLKGYEEYDIAILRSYEFQKEFLEEFPERTIDLRNFGLNDRIKQEYSELIGMFPKVKSACW